MNEIRLFQEKDLAKIYEIYKYYVENSDAIFDVTPMNYDTFSKDILETSKEYPFYVAVHDDNVIGFAYVHKAFYKEAYRYCVELTIYFVQGNHYGLASPLLTTLEKACNERNIRWIISCITDTNVESISFHKKHGYRKTGQLPNCGLKCDTWKGVVWLCKDLYFKDESFYQGENVVLKGDIKIGKDSSIWHGAIIRGDSAKITIGSETNIQDLCVLHVDENYPSSIGDRVTIGHGAIIHGATIEDEVLIGMGAIIMNGAHIKSHSIIAAGALVLENTVVENGSLVVGTPAKTIKKVTDEQIEMIKENAKHYVKKAKEVL